MNGFTVLGESPLGPSIISVQMRREIFMLRVAVMILFMSPLVIFAETISVQVQAEEEVYKFVNPDNGSGPMWAFGSTEIARSGDDVFVCQMETGEGIPPLSNTRWRLLRRTSNGWAVVAQPDAFIQREPCPLAVIGDTLFLSVNDSTQPPGTKYGNCEPHILRFTFNEGKADQAKLMPVWKKQHTFTDHSYRGFAADPAANQVVMLNIDAVTSEQNACLMTPGGETVGGASVSFPIRACYPQVALHGNAVHVLAISDIVEPVAEWKSYKFEQTQSSWDYVFRILYYTVTPDITTSEFAAPIEIANVDKTGGHISNQDLWIGPDSKTYIMYTECEVASALLRDKFFPDKSIIASLYLSAVRNGAIESRRILYPGNDNGQAACARFHVASNGTVYAVLYVSGPEAGNKLVQVFPPVENPPLIAVPAKNPLASFCLANTRAGNAPSDTIDMLGPIGETLSYMQVQIQGAEN